MSDNQHRYKWQSPLEWLVEKSKEWEPDEVLCTMHDLAAKLSSDELQDLFETEMDRDGYFDEVHSHGEYEGKAEDCPVCETEERDREGGDL